MEENEKVAPVEVEQKSNNMLMIGAVLILVVAGVAFVLMNNKGAKEEANEMQLSDTSTQSQEMTPDTVVPSVEGASDSAMVTTVDGVTTVNLEAGSFYFKPNEIRVKKGDKVKIIMTSKDMMHDFYIDELNVKLPITKAGETNTVEFTPTKTGTFEYYCSVGQHRKNGQVGKIIVE